MASNTLSAPAGAAQQPISTAQLLEVVEHLRKGTYCLRLVANDEQLDASIGNSLDFIAECQEQGLAVVAAGIRALCPA
jgi:hypothetical protein